MAWADTLKAKYLLAAMMTAALAACGGGGSGSGVAFGGGGGLQGDDELDPDEDPANPTEPTSTVTYYPLQFFLQGSNYVTEDVFDGVWFDPMIHGYVISPVDQDTLEPVDADVDEFLLSIDGELVDAAEQGLVMQRLLGLPVSLDTAILIDTSGSSSNIESVSNLFQEVRDFIATARASSNPAIRNQRFIIWEFNDQVNAVTTSLSTDDAALNTALNGMQSSWDPIAGTSGVYEAIFYAIGSYLPDAVLERQTEVRTDGIPDLVDSYIYNADYGSGRTRLDGMRLTNVVLFASGRNTKQDVSMLDAEEALAWQSLVVYEDVAEEEGEDGSTDEDTLGEDEEPVEDTEQSEAIQEGTALLSKPMIYVSLGTPSPDTDLSSMSASVIDTNSWSDFSGTAEQIITAQQDIIRLRTRNSNQYMIRYIVPERGGRHDIVLTSNTSGFNYALTTDLNLVDRETVHPA